MARGAVLRAVSLSAAIALTGILAAVLVWNVMRDRADLERLQRETVTAAAPAPGATHSFAEGAATTASPESIATSEAVFRKASPSIVTVKVYRGGDPRSCTQGSGVVVASGTVATNRHVVEGGGEIRVVDGGRSYGASVKYADPEYDLCALEVPGLSAPPAEAASVNTLRAGQRVYAIGAPRGLELTISDGLVSSLRPYGAFPLIQTNASISQGSSGGGLFDTDGRLVGITTAAAIGGQNINFALAADLVPHLPARTADIRTLAPIAPLRRADEIADKPLLDDLREVKRALSEREAELKVIGDNINDITHRLNELQDSMVRFLSSRDAKGYDAMVPRYNDLVRRRNDLVDQYEGKRQAYQALVERQNRLAEQYNQARRLP